MKVYIGPYTHHYSAYSMHDWWLEKNHKKPYYEVEEEAYTKTDVALEKLCDYTQTILNKTINKFIEWRGRRVKVRIDKYDTWNMDDTLSIIILPMLKQLKKEKHGAPLIDDEDVPEELRSTSALVKKNEWDTDGNHFKRWDYILDEMIFAFELKKDDEWQDQFYIYSGELDINWVESDYKYDGEKTYRVEKGQDNFKIDFEGLNLYNKRMRNGFRLFGKYYENLWD